jgi:hypothetical protein
MDLFLNLFSHPVFTGIATLVGIVSFVLACSKEKYYWYVFGLSIFLLASSYLIGRDIGEESIRRKGNPDNYTKIGVVEVVEQGYIVFSSNVVLPAKTKLSVLTNHKKIIDITLEKRKEDKYSATVDKGEGIKEISENDIVVIYR